MTTYGIDAHMLLRQEKDGVPRYVDRLLRAMMTMPLGDDERVLLYANGKQPDDLVLPKGWSWVELQSIIPRGWTHVRLSLEMLIHPPTVLFVPGHEVPAVMRVKTKVVTTVHDIAFLTTPGTYSAKNTGRQRFALARATHRATSLLTPSESTAHDLLSYMPALKDRVHVTPLAPCLSRVEGEADDVLRRFRVVEGKYILFLGRLETKKNVGLLIQAFAKVKQRLGAGHPLALVLAGKFGFGMDDILRTIATSGCENDIRVPGFISDHDASLLLSHALCFAFPSKVEGFGMPILEAMHHGAPVVASAIPSTVEVAGDAAMLISPNDVGAFAEALWTLVHNPAHAQELQKKGFARGALFSWDRCAKETFDVLRDVVRA